MSQTENAVTSSSGAKRAYRKGKPLSEAERQRLRFSGPKTQSSALQ